VSPEQAPLLSSYLSSPVVGRCLHLWPIFSYVMPCFGFWLPGSVSVFFQTTSVFHLWVFASLLNGVLLSFLCLKGLVGTKLFAKLGCCRTLCPFS
jgi:hypothetical protein